MHNNSKVARTALTKAAQTRMIQIVTDEATRLGYVARSYSGRGMNGRRCLAVTVPNPVGFACVIGNTVAQLGAEIDTNISWDQMGNDYVVYWPGLAAPVGT